MQYFKTLSDINCSGKRVLLRVDFNVPINEGVIQSDERIKRALPTINTIRKQGGKVIILAHLGRPDGEVNKKFTLKPIAEHLSKLLGMPIAFAEDCIGVLAKSAVANMHDGDVLMLENVRFHKEEEKNDPDFVNELASLGDIFVSDAFSASHRAHASTEGIAHKLPSVAGKLMEEELNALESALENPKRPTLAIVGGAKISTKIAVLHNLMKKMDYIIIAGGMANTFLYASGVSVGKSLCEKDMATQCLSIMQEAKDNGCTLLLPVDAIVAQEFKANTKAQHVLNAHIPDDGMILDIGGESIKNFVQVLGDVKTVLWNGPVGAFEIEPFDVGTITLAKNIALRTKEGKIISVAGGGDTVSALEKAGVMQDISYVSTAGGAFLEWMEGKTLPGVAVLKKYQQMNNT